MNPEPVCECGCPESSHVILARGVRGGCGRWSAAGACGCKRFTAVTP